MSLEEVEFRDVHRLEHDNAEKDGLSFNPTRLNTGGNSGYQAIGLAVLLGVKRIVLLGYDMKLGPAGVAHHHPDHVTRNPTEGQFKSWLGRYRTLPPDLDRVGVEVVNATRDTALDMFPLARLEDAL